MTRYNTTEPEYTESELAEIEKCKAAQATSKPTDRVWAIAAFTRMGIRSIARKRAAAQEEEENA